MGTPDVGVVWTTNNSDNIVRAMVIFFAKNSGTRGRFMQELSILRSFCGLPAYLPSLIIRAALTSTERRMVYFRKTIGKTDIQLARFPNGRDATSMYSAATSIARSLAGIQREVRIMLRMAEKCLSMQLPAALRNDPEAHKQATELKNALCYFRQVMQAMIEDSEEDLKHISRQLESVLSIMAQAQQELSIEMARAQSRLAEDTRKDQAISIEIAEASKRIAEDTKRDGTSMKTLAVVT